MEINITTLYKLITKHGCNDIDGFSYVDIIIKGCDEEDGGGRYELILKEIATDKFYLTGYCDWDILNTTYDKKTDSVTSTDLDSGLIEVFPFEKTIIEYRKTK